MRIFVCVLLCVGCTQSGPSSADLAQPDLAASSKPTAHFSATPDVVGFVSRLDGSGSSDPQNRTLTYLWHFVAVPPGSKLDDTAFSGGPTPTFDPDLGGTYTVQLTVTAPDSSSDSITSDVVVPTLPVFYREGVLGATSSFAVGVVRSDGSGAHRISCAVTSTGPGDLGGDDVFDLLEFPGLLSMRVYDGTPSRIVYEDVTPSIAGGQRTLQHSLWIADEQSDCTLKPPRRLDDTTLPGASKLGPRFSPDGSRLAYLEQNRLVTVAADGSAQHVVRSGGLVAAPPVWIDATHLMWVEDPSPSPSPHPQFVSGVDQNAAVPAPVLDCPPGADNLAVINQFERLSDGTLVVAGGRTPRAQGGSISLYKLGASCSVAAATVLVTPGVSGDAWDFAVSPDELTVALSSSVVQAAAPAPQHDLYLAKIDGSGTALFSGSDALTDDVGPRWLAAGRQLSWTQAARPNDAGVSGGAGVLVANLNGSHLRSLKAESANTVLVAPSNRGLACDFGDGEVSPLLLLLFVIILGACLVSWRRSTTG
jgi:hypothetical protein